MNNIEALLKKKGVTKTALSDKLGIKKQNLNSMFRNPTMDTMKKIASALDVPIWELFVSREDIIGVGDGNCIVCPKCGAKLTLKVE